MSLVKHSKNNLFVVWIICSIFLISCSKEQKTDEYIAKVDKSILTKSMLDSSLASYSNSAKAKEEFVNDWIETEILYQEAVKEGITKEKKFASLIEKSQKELAGTFLLQKLIDENKFDPTDDEIQKYFDEKKDDFRLTEDLFKINIANFSDYSKAIQFRNKLLETNWATVENIYRLDKNVNVEKNKLIFRSELQPVVFSKVVGSMLPNEISIILETQPNNYAVVQTLEKYMRESVPPLDIMKEEVKSRLTVIKKKDFVNNFINKLISDHDLEIERYTE